MKFTFEVLWHWKWLIPVIIVIKSLFWSLSFLFQWYLHQEVFLALCESHCLSEVISLIRLRPMQSCRTQQPKYETADSDGALAARLHQSFISSRILQVSTFTHRWMWAGAAGANVAPWISTTGCSHLFFWYPSVKCKTTKPCIYIWNRAT